MPALLQRLQKLFSDASVEGIPDASDDRYRFTITSGPHAGETYDISTVEAVLLADRVEAVSASRNEAILYGDGFNFAQPTGLIKPS